MATDQFQMLGATPAKALDALEFRYLGIQSLPSYIFPPLFRLLNDRSIQYLQIVLDSLQIIS